jgi:hypothetical protein
MKKGSKKTTTKMSSLDKSIVNVTTTIYQQKIEKSKYKFVELQVLIVTI